MRLAAPEVFMMSAPNPTSNNTTIRYRVESRSMINIEVYDAAGNKLTVLVNQTQDPGSYSVMFNAASLPSGVYMIKAVSNGVVKQALRVVKN
jgi:serine protease AprX